MPEQTPSIGRIVIYTDSQDKRHAAIISEDPEPGSRSVMLVAFALHGSTAHPIYAEQGEGRGKWQWPQYVPPKAD